MNIRGRRALAQVGAVEVPASAVRHRFFREALAGALLVNERTEGSPVVGTSNSKQPELYGWAAMVGEHVDNTGYVYLCPLSDGGAVHCGGEVVELRRGAVVRLHDYQPHSVKGDAVQVAVFVGSFDVPHDALAVAMIQDAIARLARGDYYGAPRAAGPWRVLLADECLATDDFEQLQTMLLADAEARGMYVERCACGKPATKPDHYWPHYSDKSTCNDCRFH